MSVESPLDERRAAATGHTSINRIGLPPVLGQVTRFVSTRRAGLEYMPRAEGRGLGRVHRSGERPIRVLLFGSGATRGFGVRTHDLGLAAGIADALSQWTGRGVKVDVTAVPDPTTSDSLAALERGRLDRYDAIVLTLSVRAAWELRSSARRKHELTRLVTTVIGLAAPSAEIVIAGWRPLLRIAGLDSISGPLTRYWDERLDAVTRQVCRDTGRVHRLEDPPQPPERTPAQSAAVVYGAWGADIGKQLSVQFIHAAGPDLAIDEPAQPRPDDEAERQAAVVASRLRGAVGDRRLTHLARLARLQYGTSHAELNIVDGDLQRTIASANDALGQVPRTEGICPITIEQDDALILLDVEHDPRIPGTPRTPGGDPIRFYVGVSIESPDGYRIGALCVYDEGLRPNALTDSTALKSLAADVEKRVWEIMQTDSDTDDDSPTLGPSIGV